MLLCRFHHPERGTRLGFVKDDELYDLSERWPTLSALLRDTMGRSDIGAMLNEAIADAAPVAPISTVGEAAVEGALHLLKPTDAQEVWAAGVTYERSRIAREEESAGSGIYERVYDAARPEIFFKATPSRTVGPRDNVVIRKDATWNVPEPELGLVVNPALELVGFTIGNDMSSRDIEGENPLYLPQAKVYAGCCALGPFIALRETISDPKNLTIRLTIMRDEQTAFTGEANTSKIVRSFDDLIEYLGRDNVFPDGVVLITGTGIVPPDSFTLAAGDEVAIAIDGIGELRNPVVRGASHHGDG